MLTDQQKAFLEAPLSRAHVRTRSQSGRNLSYLESWVAISEANRIFGFDGWNRETVELKCVAEKERKIGSAGNEGWGVTYIAKVRVTVTSPDGMVIIREGCGAGHGIDRDLGQAHESALKEAESDAGKRALMTFGNPFGLALYDKDQANVEDAPKTAAPPMAPKASPVEKKPTPAASANVSDEVKARAARTWANSALDNMKNFIDVEKFSDWADANADHIARVRNYDEALHAKLTEAIRNRYALLQPVNAG